MTAPTFARRWPLAMFAGLILLMAGATVALADGEDDPSFGTLGTTYGALFDENGGFLPILTPQASVGPDKAIVEAGAVQLAEPAPPPRGRNTPFGVQVSRVLPNGAPDATFGTGGTQLVATPQPPELLDVRVLGDRSIMLAVAAGETLDRAAGPERAVNGFVAVAIRLIHLDEQGGVIDEPAFVAPEGCDTAEAAEIAADGSAFGLWTNCSPPDEERVLESFGDRLVHIGTDESDWNVGVPFVHSTDVALGPDDVPHVLGWMSEAEQTDNVRGIPNSDVDSVVLRFAPDDGAFDGTYGGPDQRLDGPPIDFDVDGSSRAVVWVGDAIAATRAVSTWMFRRLTADGTVDDTYGSGGLATLSGDQLPTPYFQHLGAGCPSLLLFDVCDQFQVRAQPDGKLIALGSNLLPNRSTPPPDRVIGRLTAAGQPDPTWDGDGLRDLRIVPGPGQFALILAAGQPVLQADGKVLVPFTAAAGAVVGGGRIAAPAADAGHGLQRLNESPPTTTTTTPTTTTTTAPPVGQAPAPVVLGGAPSVRPRICVSRRTFTIRLRTGRRKSERSPIVSAVVRVNGKKVKVTRRARRTARVNLTKLPKGRFKVTIALRLKDGGRVSETRRYRTCTKKIERELGPLRTHPPHKKRKGRRR